ncbi:hypothetical protein Dimus_018047 [Dionaea muscipula]
MKVEKDEANLKARQLKDARVAIKEYLGSEDFVKMFSPIMIRYIVNGFKIGLDKCKRTSKRGGKTIQCLKSVKFNPDVDYKFEPIPSRLTLCPVVWNTDGRSDPLEYVEKWGQEFLQGSSDLLRPEKGKSLPRLLY